MTLWLSIPQSFWLLRNFICVRNLTLMCCMKMTQDPSISFLCDDFFDKKKKCTLAVSHITKAKLEYLFQHAFFFTWICAEEEDFYIAREVVIIYKISIFKKKSIIFLVMIDRCLKLCFTSRTKNMLECAPIPLLLDYVFFPWPPLTSRASNMVHNFILL